jgi:gamma-butyrobetaine dioxygenase
MNIANVMHGERALMVTWQDDSVTEYPYVWLRDNDPGGFHPDAGERLFDLTTIPVDIRPDTCTLEADALRVTWPEPTSPSVFPLDWLRSHQPGRQRVDPAVVARTAWDRDLLDEIPRCRFGDCARDPGSLYDALRALKRYGILLVDGLDDSPDAAQRFGDLVGIRRRTNFGDVFEVIARPAPNNLAYTALALPLHTDLPNQELIPGYQVLHAFRNSVSGGESVFADGLRIHEDLRSAAPGDLELFRRIAIPWRFHDESNDIRMRRPIICETAAGELDYFVFNAHIADFPDMPAAELYAFYPAYQRLMNRIRQPRYAVRHALAPGEMVVFDNSRVLHGRAAFDPNSGERHLCGYYLERNEIDSRLRVLARDLATEEQECPSK